MYQEERTKEIIAKIEKIEEILNRKLHYEIIEHEDGTRYVILPFKKNKIDDKLIDMVKDYGLEFAFDDENAYIIDTP